MGKASVTSMHQEKDSLSLMTPVLTQTQRLLKLGCGIMLLEESEHPTLNEHA
jgi:hypothetical protein